MIIDTCEIILINHTCNIIDVTSGENINKTLYFMYRLDNERECSMGYSVPSIDRRPRGPKARVAFYLFEGHYIP